MKEGEIDETRCVYGTDKCITIFLSENLTEGDRMGVLKGDAKIYHK
jgi:hypothetical protein